MKPGEIIQDNFNELTKKQKNAYWVARTFGESQYKNTELNTLELKD